MTDDDVNNSALAYADTLWKSADTLCGQVDAAERDFPGFCKNASLDEVRKHGHVLTPGRYVGAERQEDDGEPFEEEMQRLVATLEQQSTEAARLDKAIWSNLKELGYGV